MSVATGHQHRVAGREGAGLTVSYTGLCYMGALAGAMAVTSHCYIEGWKERRKQPVKTAGWGQSAALGYLCFCPQSTLPSRVTHGASGSLGWLPPDNGLQ